MKQRIIQLMLFASIYTCAKAQTPATCPADLNAPISEYCEDGHGISTDPTNPENCEVDEEYPNKTNQMLNSFDWPTNKTIML